MAYENLLYEKKDGVAWITFNRPKVLNALNRKTMEELRAVLLDARDDEAVRVLILTGAGEKAFVAGADINELAAQTPISGKETAQRGQEVLQFIERFPKPVIAAVNGFALGGPMPEDCAADGSADREQPMATARSARRRLRTCAVLLDSPSQQECKARPTRGEAGNHPRLRRLTEAGAAVWEGRGARDLLNRRNDHRGGSAAHRPGQSRV